MTIFWALSGGLLIFLGILAVRISQVFRRKTPHVVQGEKAQVRKYSEPKRKRNEHFLWGNQFLDDHQASLHFLALGSTGSGKSINISLLMKTVMRRIATTDSGVRAVVYDSKTDLLSKIHEMGIREEQIMILNPFDERRWAWDIAKDITRKSEAEDIAAVLIPSEPGAKDPFFTLNAQGLLAGIILAFQQNAPENWSLRDLILASRTTEMMTAVFLSCPYTEDLAEEFNATNTGENLRSTVNTHLRKLESVAASWENASRTFVVSDWLNEQKVMVLGNSPESEEPVKRINQLLFTTLSKAILGRPGSCKAKYWFFLDELREMGNLNYLPKMMIVGRSKGASMVLGFQDIHGLYAEYGQDGAKEIVGCTQNFALLRINATQPSSQEWASKVAGQLRYEQEVKSSSVTSNVQGSQVTNNFRVEEKTENQFIPSYFSQKLQQIELCGHMMGLFFTKGVLSENTYPNEVLFHSNTSENRVPDSSNDFSDLESVKADSLLLEPWSAPDFTRLKLDLTETSKGRLQCCDLD